MKYVYLLIGILALIAMTILYFQLLTYGSYMLPFFTRFIDIGVFTIWVILLAFLSGMFITLGIKGFMSGSDTIDDDFDL